MSGSWKIEAVLFDLDGVLIDSEGVWSDVRRQFAIDHGGRWEADSQRRMMGMSSPEWATFMHDALGVDLVADQIASGVVAAMALRYRYRVPLLPDAAEAVRRLAGRWPLGLASSANRPLIDLVLDESGLAACFAVTMSTEEVAHGKPAPDVYLEAAHRLAVKPGRCAGVEDSTNGLRALPVAPAISSALRGPAMRTVRHLPSTPSSGTSSACREEVGTHDHEDRDDDDPDDR